MSGNSPDYQVRPNKAIDRMLFLNLLMKLNRCCDISQYQYIGLGSFSFEEFKLLHNQLYINDMISLEANESVFRRQQLNCPYKCIKTVQKTSGDFIADDFQRDKPVIIWLDYTEADAVRSQFEEFCTVASRLESKDILRITLNAHPKTLWSNNGGFLAEQARIKRLEVLRDRIGEFLPSGTEPSSLENKQYPKVLLGALKNALYQFDKTSPKKFLPLLSCVYADGQQMMTITGVMYSGEEEKQVILSALSGWEYLTSEWDKYNQIAIPSFTPIERLLLNQKLPGNVDDLMAVLNNTFSVVNIENYIKYYRYYPNFHQVIF